MNMMDHRICAADAEKFYAAQPFTVELLDELTGRIAVTCREKLGRVMGNTLTGLAYIMCILPGPRNGVGFLGTA